jgi:phage gp29-like protein
MKLLAANLKDNMLSAINPLRGLNMQRAVAELESGQRGDYSHLQWLYAFIEKRDATLRGAKRRILSALLKLDWDIKITDDLPPAEQARAEKQAEALKAAYNSLAGFRAALRHLALAEFRGYAHVEKRFAPGGEIVELVPVPQWHWCRDGIYGAWLFQEDALRGGINGTSIRPEQFLIREIEDPIDEISLIAFVRKNLSSKDFDSYIARYGIPFVFWILSEAMAAQVASDPAKMNDWLAVMRGIGADGEGIIPGGTLETLDSGGGSASHNVFLQHLGYQDEQIVMAATSGKLTMLNDATGLGSGNADAHEQTFDAIAQAMAMEISEIFQDQFDAPFLAKRFPGERTLCYFELAAQDAEDISQLITNVKTLADAGWIIDGEELNEKTGYTLERKQDAPPDATQKNRAGYNPNQPRDPAGVSTGGRWTKAGGGSSPSINFATTENANIKEWLEEQKSEWVESSMNSMTSGPYYDDEDGWSVDLADDSTEYFDNEEDAQARLDEERSWFESARIYVEEDEASLVDDNGNVIISLTRGDDGWENEAGDLIDVEGGEVLALTEADKDRATSLFNGMAVTKVDVVPREGGGFSFEAETGGAEPYRITGDVNDDKLVIGIMVPKDGTASFSGSSRGVGLLSQTINAADNIGIQTIETTGGKGGKYGMTGYRTWPALGFEATGVERFAEKLPPEIRPLAGDPPSLLNLTSTRDGRIWWRQNGEQLPLSFDLSADSPSRQRFAQVMQMLSR